jgi:FkbM family methyltransferase
MKKWSHNKMNLIYGAENILLATHAYRNWFDAVKAIITRHEFKHIMLKNGLEIRASQEFKWLMNQIFYKRVYTPISPLQIGLDDVVVDIGAHCGIFTMFAASLTRNTIYSFEPSPHNFQILKDNISTNNLKNVILFQLALADRVGSAPFLLNHISHQENLLRYEHLNPEQLIPQKLEEYEEIMVPITTLEHIIEEYHIEHIDFLKLDCQGAEGAIFSSTPKEYLLRIKKIAMEYHDHISLLNHDDLQKILEEAGFTTLIKKKDALSPLGFLYGWRE